MKLNALGALCALTLGLLLGASQAFAQDREFVGLSNDPAPFGDGVFGMHQACAESYRGGKMCSSADIMLNGAADGGLDFVPDESFGFVVPVFVFQDLNPPPAPFPADRREVVDFSGFSNSTLMTDYSCTNWTVSGIATSGLALEFGGMTARFVTASCAHSAQFPNEKKVACCCKVGEKCRLVLNRFGTVSPPIGENP